MNAIVDNTVNIATVTHAAGLVATVAPQSIIGANVSFPISIGAVVSPSQSINLITVSGPPGPIGPGGLSSGFAGVSYINGLSGSINLIGSGGVYVYPNGNDLIIAYTGIVGGSGAVSSVFGRDGDVVADPEDYSDFYGRLDFGIDNYWDGGQHFAGSLIYPVQTIILTGPGASFNPIYNYYTADLIGEDLVLTPTADIDYVVVRIDLKNNDNVAYTITGGGTALGISYTAAGLSTTTTYWTYNPLMGSWILIGPPVTIHDLETATPTPSAEIPFWDGSTSKKSTLGDITSGIVSGLISTGNADARYYPLNSNPALYVTSGSFLQTGANLVQRDLDISGALNTKIANTGQTLYQSLTGASGYILGLISSSSAGVGAINGQSGLLTLQGAGSVSVFTNGQTITISGSGVAGGVTQAQLDLLSGQIIQTGALAFARDISVSGGLEQRIFLSGAAAVAYTNVSVATTGQQAWQTAQNNAINLSGNLAATGATLITRDLSTSGALDTKIVATGTSTVTHANGIGSILSGLLTQTGIVLGAKITSLSGYSDSIFIHRTGDEIISGIKTFVNIITASGGIDVPTGASGTYRFNGSTILKTSAQDTSTYVGVGAGSSASNITTSSTYVGAAAASQMITGLANTFIGASTAIALRTGNNMVSIGYASLSAATGNVDNTVVIGVGALQQLVSGVGNTVIGGSSTASELVIGANNVVVGYQAGGSNFITGNNNIAIGKGALISSDSFRMNIGNGLFGSQMGLGTARIGINNSNPQYNLHVSGDTCTTNLILLSGEYAGGTVVSANYNVGINDNRIYCNNTNPITLTFGSVFAVSGQLIRIKLVNTGAVYFTGTAGQLFDGSPLYSLIGQYNTKELHAFNGQWNLW